METIRTGTETPPLHQVTSRHRLRVPGGFDSESNAPAQPLQEDRISRSSSPKASASPLFLHTRRETGEAGTAAPEFAPHEDGNVELAFQQLLALGTESRYHSVLGFITGEAANRQLSEAELSKAQVTAAELITEATFPNKVDRRALRRSLLQNGTTSTKKTLLTPEFLAKISEQDERVAFLKVALKDKAPEIRGRASALNTEGFISSEADRLVLENISPPAREGTPPPARRVPGPLVPPHLELPHIEPRGFRNGLRRAGRRLYNRIRNWLERAAT